MNKNRYEHCEKLKYVDANGVSHQYYRPRVIPNTLAESRPTQTVEQARLDIFTYAVLGMSELFWMILDENTLLNPFMFPSLLNEDIRIPRKGYEF